MATRIFDKLMDQVKKIYDLAHFRIFFFVGLSWFGWEVFLSLGSIWHSVNCWRCHHGNFSFFINFTCTNYSGNLSRVWFFLSSGEFLHKGYWSCWLGSTWSTREGTSSSSTACRSLHTLWTQSWNNSHLQGSRKAPSQGALSCFLGSHIFAIPWIFDWGEFSYL